MTKINRSALVSLLARVAPAVAVKSPHAVLVNVRLHAAAGTITASATNLVLSIVSTSPALGDIDAIVDCASLRASVAGLPDGEVSLSVDGTKLVVRGGSRRFSLPMWDNPTAWPEVNVSSDAKATVVTFDGADLATAFARVLPAACTDEGRPHLHGVLLETHADGYRLVATDGHRLHVADVAAEGLPSGEVLLPLSAARAIASVAAENASVTLEWTEARVVCAVGHHRVSFGRVEAVFPPWRQVVPSVDGGPLATVDAAPLGQALKALAAVGESTSARLEFEPGALRLSASGSRGEAVDELASDCTRAIVLGANAGYLASALSACGADRVALLAASELDPMMFWAPGVRAVVMPIRL